MYLVENKESNLGRENMEKSIFWLFGIFLLVFQDSGSDWAQNEAEGKNL
jgi:mono/diheme cytochrome c family protein